jgi:hypothetical protein
MVKFGQTSDQSNCPEISPTGTTDHAVEGSGMRTAWVDREALARLMSTHVSDGESWASARLALMLLVTPPLILLALSLGIKEPHVVVLVVALGFEPYIGFGVGLSGIWDWDTRRRRGRVHGAIGTVIAPTPGEPEITVDGIALRRREGSPPLPPPGEYRITWLQGHDTYPLAVEPPDHPPAVPPRLPRTGPDQVTFVASLLFAVNFAMVLAAAVPATALALDNEHPAGALVFMGMLLIGFLCLWGIPAKLLITDWFRTRRNAPALLRLDALTGTGHEVSTVDAEVP